VRYRECMKNHAVSIGGHAIDGCGEFMPSGEEGTLEALKCAACNCHRNFHRREVEGEPPCYYCYNPRKDGRKRPAGGSPLPLALPSTSPSGVITRPSPQMIMAFGSGPTHENDQQEHDLGSLHGLHGPQMAMPIMKKRFRTKFTQEQKDKMCSFAEKLGWRIQKHDEAAVQQFCMELGVKRHVLKVWMHNNKHTLGKKIWKFLCSFSSFFSADQTCRTTSFQWMSHDRLLVSMFMRLRYITSLTTHEPLYTFKLSSVPLISDSLSVTHMKPSVESQVKSMELLLSFQEPIHL